MIVCRWGTSYGAWSRGEANSIKTLDQFSSFSIFRTPIQLSSRPPECKCSHVHNKKSPLWWQKMIDARWCFWWTPHRLVASLLRSALLCPTAPIFHYSMLNFTTKLLLVPAFQPAICVLKCWIIAFDSSYFLQVLWEKALLYHTHILICRILRCPATNLKCPLAVHAAQDS